MKCSTVGLLALAGLGYALPHVHRQAHENHNNLHEPRDVVTTVVMTTIFVDQNGQVISTASQDASTPTTSTTDSSATQAAATTSSTDSQPTQSSQSSSSGSGYGMAYDMISTGPCKDAATIDSDMALLSSNGYTQVRTYDIGCDIGVLVKSAQNHGMKALVGINDISNVAGDIGKLISYITNADAWSGVDTVNVGNEVVNNGGSAASVVAAIGVAKPLLEAAGFTGNVVTVDTFNQHLANPSLCAASSYCAINAQPYFDPSCTSSNAGAWVMKNFNAVKAQAGGKDVVVTEAGWPYSGSSNGNAVASPSDQTTAVNSIKQAFSSQPGSVYLFQGFDASYKTPGSLGIEQYYGIFDH